MSPRWRLDGNPREALFLGAEKMAKGLVWSALGRIFQPISLAGSVFLLFLCFLSLTEMTRFTGAKSCLFFSVHFY